MTQIPNLCQIWDMDWCKNVWFILYLLNLNWKCCSQIKHTGWPSHSSSQQTYFCVSYTQQTDLGRDIDLKMEDNGCRLIKQKGSFRDGWGWTQYHRMKALYIQGKIHKVGKIMAPHWQQSTYLLSYWVEQRSWYHNCPIPFSHGDPSKRQCQCTWAGIRSNQENSHNYHHSLSWHPSEWLLCHLMQLEHKRWNILC